MSLLLKKLEFTLDLINMLHYAVPNQNVQIPGSYSGAKLFSRGERDKYLIIMRHGIIEEDARTAYRHGPGGTQLWHLGHLLFQDEKRGICS